MIANGIPLPAVALSLALLSIGTANATLIDRGGGLIYDSSLNVTWMQDAQYSITSGFNTSGRLNWQAANDWATGLQFHDSVRGVTWDDWRLPTTVNSMSSLGYDLTGLSSELAHLYYVDLGFAPNYTHDRFAPVPTSGNYNPFINVAYRGYWSATASDFAGQAWGFHFHFGSQELNGMSDEGRVWLLRDGDVASPVSVPEPATAGLFGLLLAGLGLIRRDRSAAASHGPG